MRRERDLQRIGVIVDRESTISGARVAGAMVRAVEAGRRRTDELLASDRARTAFFNNVSHEFRTPLTLMLGPTKEALFSPARALRGNELELVYRNQLRLLRLVNTLLDFASIEAGRLQASYTPVNLGALTADLASAFRSMIESAGMKLIVDCRVLSQPVYVDLDLWEKIIFNLMSNAFKYTLEGGVFISVRELLGKAQVAGRVEAERDKLEVAIAVATVLVISVPQVQDGSFRRCELSAGMCEEAITVATELFAMRGVLAQHFVDALAVVISDGSVRDQVIAASR